MRLGRQLLHRHFLDQRLQGTASDRHFQGLVIDQDFLGSAGDDGGVEILVHFRSGRVQSKRGIHVIDDVAEEE